MRIFIRTVFSLIFFFIMLQCAYAQLSGSMGDWVEDMSLGIIVLELDEVTSFEDLPVDDRFDKVPENLEKIKKGFASGNIKAVMLDVKVRNNTRKIQEIGHRVKLSGKGDFVLLSDSGITQDSANRNEFHEIPALQGVVLSGRRLLNLGESFMPASASVSPGASLRGKLLFLVPADFKPGQLLFKGSFSENELVINLDWGQ